MASGETSAHDGVSVKTIKNIYAHDGTSVKLVKLAYANSPSTITHRATYNLSVPNPTGFSITPLDGTTNIKHGLTKSYNIVRTSYEYNLNTQPTSNVSGWGTLANATVIESGVEWAWTSPAGVGDGTVTFTSTYSAINPVVINQPSNATVSEGASQNIFSCRGTVETSEGIQLGQITYQWQKWNGSTWSNVGTATTRNSWVYDYYYVSNIQTSAAGTYRCRLTSTYNSSVMYTSQVTLTVNPSLTISITTGWAAHLTFFGTATAGVRFLTTGRLQKRAGTSYTDVSGEYADPTSTGLGSDYDVRMIRVSGATVYGMVSGTWYQNNVNRECYVTTTGSYTSAAVDLSIRRRSDQSILVNNVRYTLEAEVSGM